ncbi:F-box protein SKIP23-like isoform X2 [Durio zibethinus]|uniref:F-box protein SKIP23-like isoform X2 n=1 Tax=Durio zibethinus TaxID=66656 RepID=A0A6P6ADN6_DURZI|nr:F-box protein SKIP23-like isoform X2 [Durio zibethinus]
MADWTQLPQELLDLISKRLDTSYDVIRFRSVCSTWRSSVTTPKRHRLAPRFPVLPDEGGMVNTSFGFSLSKRTVFLLQSPETNIETDTLTSWVIKIEEDVPKNRIQLLNPLSRSGFDSLPDNFPKSLNLLEFRVFELGEEYVLHYLNHLSYLGDVGNLYMEKVVLSCLDNNANDFVLLTIHVSGKLAMFKSIDKKWTIIQDMPSPYDDVILHEGNFYAVDNTGRTVLVALDFEISVVGMPVFGGDKKFLVESKGELLLVDMYLSIEAEEGSCSWAGLGFVEEYFENLAFYMNERTVRFKVFKLDEVGKEWVDVKSLNGRVLFLGDDCTFSASAEDLSVCRGNCIIFADNCFYSLGVEDGSSERCDVGVFDLENGSIGPLQKFPQFSKVFWPPPRWISSTTLDHVRS